MRAYENPLAVYGPPGNRLLSVSAFPPVCPTWRGFLCGLGCDEGSSQRFLATDILGDRTECVTPEADLDTALQKGLAAYLSLFHPDHQPYPWPDLTRELGQILVWLIEGSLKVRAASQAREALPTNIQALVLLSGTHTFWMPRIHIHPTEAGIWEHRLRSLFGQVPVPATRAEMNRISHG
jgi:hypothetical protein